MPAYAPIPELTVRTDDGRVFRFSHPFHVGRGGDCEVQIDDTHVSRRHLRVSCTDGRWSFMDLNSSNGVFVKGRRVASDSLEDARSLRLGGPDGPTLSIDIEQLDAPTMLHMPAGAHVQPGGSETRVIASYTDKYFGAGSADEPAGPRTTLIRKAFQKAQKKQKRRVHPVARGSAVPAGVAEPTAGLAPTAADRCARRSVVLSPHVTASTDARRVHAIEDMVTSPDYRHVPTGTLAVLAQRLGTIWASPSAWYGLVRTYGWRRPRLRLPPAKPTVGLRTTRPDEMWHIDTTVIRLLDGTRAYLHAVIDNVSRRMLA